MAEEIKRRYLFQITVGPVQEFIMSARRSRDLWYGSFMLSELSRAAAQAIPEWETHLIFPSFEVIKQALANAQEEPANIANKIIAIVDTDNIQSFGDTIKEAVYDRIHHIRDQAFEHHITWNAADRPLAEQQVEDMLECYWVAVPYDGVNYSKQRETLEQMMAGRKATRDFQPVELSSGRGRFPKSSIDGQRESVILESNYPSRNDDEQSRRDKLQNLYKHFGAKQAERLSGVDLLKRRGRRSTTPDKQHEGLADFPSTSHFAALPFLQRIATQFGAEKIRTAFDQYCQELESFVTDKRMVSLEKVARPYQEHLWYIAGYDASIFYESRLAEEIDVRDEQTRRSAISSLHHFLRVVAMGAQPGAYYALIHADGDGMGKVIDNQQSLTRHQQLSYCLAQFAHGVRAIVEQWRGALVYAGGDDVLAFVPVDTVLECAQELHRAFEQQVGNGTYTDSKGNPPTLSVGIAICHHLEPLSEALALVRRAEQAAKQVKNKAGEVVKNGLAIAVEKRSGEPRMIAGSWASEDGEPNFFERFQTWLTLMGDDELSAGAPYELLDLVVRLGEPENLKAEPESHHQAVAEEAGRIIERKQKQRGEQKVDEKTINVVREQLGLPKKINGKLTIPENGERYGKQKLTVRRLADELIVARELVRLGARPRAVEQGVEQ